MIKHILPFLVMLIPATAFPITTHYISVDTADQLKPFELVLSRGSTPNVKASIYNMHEAETNVSDFGAYLYYAESAYAAGGVFITASATNDTGYYEFQFSTSESLGLSEDADDYPITYFCQLVLTNAGGAVYDWSQGKVKIRASGSAAGAADIVLAGAETDPLSIHTNDTFVNLTWDSSARTLTAESPTGGVDVVARAGVASNVLSIASNVADIAELDATVVTNVICSGESYNESFFTLDYAASMDSAITNDSISLSTNVDVIYKSYAIDQDLFQYIPDIAIYANRESNSISITPSAEIDASVDANGVVDFTSSTGSATVVVALDGFSRTTNVTAGSIYGTTNTVAITGTAGSYREALCGWTDARTKTGLGTALYSTYDGATTSYVRNTSCWAYDADLTCASPYNSLGGNLRAGTLITPQHIVYAVHYPLPVGTVMQFVDATNSVEVRTITAVDSVSGTDIGLALLDSALPTNRFTPARILASDYSDYLPVAQVLADYIPAVSLDRAEIVACRAGSVIYDGFYDRVPTLTNRYAYYNDVNSGDSGNPIFLVSSNAAPVALSTWHYSWAGDGIGANAANIQTAINGLGGTETNLTYAVLSEFTTF